MVESYLGNGINHEVSVGFGVAAYAYGMLSKLHVRKTRCGSLIYMAA